MRMYNKCLLTLSGLFFCLAANAAHFAGSTKFVSNYIWRGVSQTNNDGAVQGDLSYQLDSGFYIGMWGSNVNFGDEDPAHLELDYYGGFAHDFNDNWGFDASLLQYTYPSANDLYNYVEGQLIVHYKFIKAGLAYTDDNFNTGSRGYYYTLAAEHELVPNTNSILFKDLYVGGHIGYFDINADAVAGGSYSDYQLYLRKEVAGIALEGGWTDEHGRDLGDKLGGEHFYVSIAKNFE